ncbi:Ig-like domain-containing protein, partial [Archangium sp.]|uniref:Ig-like domain-containing protein n=1 Tax=Archangium sp. TaxID=1872627 RepID=UPI002ED88570
TTVSIRAEGVDKMGAIAKSDTLLVRLVGNSAPLVSIQRPLGAVVDATAAVPLEVRGIIGDDSLTFGVNASLLVDGTAVGTARLNEGGISGTATGVQSFSFQWTPPVALIGKTVRIEVQAVDHGGLVRRVGFDASIRTDQPPQVSVLTPTAGQDVRVGTDLVLTANVVDDGVDPVLVSWSINGAPVGMSSAPPYRVHYRLPLALAGSPLTVTALARDSKGNQREAVVTATASSDTQAPSVSLLVPKDRTEVARSQPLLVSVAGLDDVDVVRAEILLDGVVVFTDYAPGENAGVRGSFMSHAVLTPEQLPQQAASFKLSARAYDAAGNVGTSPLPDVLVYTRADAAPTVAFASPASGASVTAGTDLEVLVQAKDDVGVQSVKLFADNILMQTLGVPPYRFVLRPSGAGRTMTLRAEVADAANQTASVELPVQVVEDSEAPLVAFRSPNQGARVFAGRSTAVEVVASDNVSVSQAELFLGTQSLGTKTGGLREGLYQVFSWNVAVPAQAAGSTLSLRAVARDASGRKSESTLELNAVTDLPPRVSLALPAPGSPFREGEDVTVTFTVADDDGVVAVAGVSGGQVQGALTPGTKPLDQTRQQKVVVRAPLKGQPATVGAIARDTAGHEARAEVSLDVAKDVEPPKAVLVAPLPPQGGALEVGRGGALGVRVEVEDDVRVHRVALFVDGQEVPLKDGKEWMAVQAEKFEEVRAPNPLGPGDIVVSRRYVGTFSGTLPIAASWADGKHQLTARALDPAGNVTPTTAVEFTIVPVVDRLPPTVRINLNGVPDERNCVAGSKLEVVVSATDDGSIDTLSLELDGQPVTPLAMSHYSGSAAGRAEVTLPAFNVSDPRTLTFTAQAKDGQGRLGHASRSCELVADQAPLVRWISPAQPGLLSEERVHAATLEVQEDVGLKAGWLVMSSAPVQSAAGNSFQVQASALPAARSTPGATLEFGHAQEFKVASVSGALVFTPHGAPVLDDRKGSLFLRVEPSPTGAGAVADVTYRYRVRPGKAGSSELATFLATAPGGQRTVTLGSPGYGVDLSFPWTAIEVDSVDIQLAPVSGEAEPLTVTRIGLRNPGKESAQVRVIAEGQRVAVQAVDPKVTPGRPQNKSFSPIVPVGWAPQNVILTGIFVDSRNVATRSAMTTSTTADLERPRVSVASPANGATVVADVPFDVELASSDDVSVDHLELFVDGVSKGTAVPWNDASTKFTLSLPLPSGAAPAELSAQARDRFGNTTTSSPIFLRVVPDAAPSVTLVSLRSALEMITRAELDSGFVRLLQGAKATLAIEAKDDVGVASVRVEYAGAAIYEKTLSPAQKTFSPAIEFTPPVGQDGSAQVLWVKVTDTKGVQYSKRVVVESRRPSAPLLAFSSPVPGAYLVEGSIQLRVEAVATDDTRVESVEFLINDQPALEVTRNLAKGIEVKNVNGTLVVGDPAVRAALESLKATAEDAFLYRRFGGVVELPPGFIRLDPTRTETFIRVRAVATDAEGNKSSVEHRVRLEADNAAPVADVLRPNLGKDVIEGTPVLIQVDAYDNAFVDRVEILAGPSAADLRVVHVASGFKPVNAVAGADFGIHAPVVTYEHIVPRLSELGALDLVPYFVAVRARDVSGNWSERTFQQIDVVRDREPALSILSPANGSRAVAKNKLPVLVAAEDDVALTRIQLYVDGVVEPLTITEPPYAFLVDVPESATELKLRAKAVDSYGHEIYSQHVVLSVVADRAPTVAVAQPSATDTLTEGRDFGLLIAAQDDVEVTSVEVTVEGGVNGTLRFVSAARPYSFRVPLPYGSAGRSLTIRAQARDSAGQVSLAPERVVPVVKDTHAPTVSFFSPVHGAQIVEGLRVDVEARAEDDVGVTRVTFKDPSGKELNMPAPPYRFSYAVPKGRAGQTITFVAEAVDFSGNTTTSSVSLDVIHDEPPTVSLTGPTELVVGVPSTFSAKASDDVAVANVTFYSGPNVDSLQEVGRRFILPYYHAYIAEPSQVDSSLVFRVKAVDTAGHETWSLPVTVPVKGDRPPSVALLKPGQGTTLFEGARLRLEAEASDPEGRLASVTFFVDGRKVETLTEPAGIPGAPNVYAASFTPTAGAGNRTFAVKAVALDTAGHEAASAETLVGTVADQVAPVLELVDPPDLDLVTVGEPLTLATAAEDNAGLSNVEFFVNGTTLGTTNVPVPGPANRPLYKMTWLPDGTPGTQQTIRASAKDRSGNSGDSQQVKVELGLRPSERFLSFNGSGGSNPRVGPLVFNGKGLALLGGRSVKATSTGRGLQLMQIQPTGVSALGMLAIDREPVAAAFHGDLALVTTRPESLQGQPYHPAELLVVDVSNPNVPVLKGRIDLPGPEATGVVADGRLALVANGNAGIVMVDIGNPMAPQRLSSPPNLGGARGLAVAGDSLLVASGTAGLVVRDLSDPYLGKVGLVALPGEARAVSVVGHRAFVACEGSSASLAVVDVRNPKSPLLVSLLSHVPARKDLLTTGLNSVAVAGNLVVTTARLIDADNNPVKGVLSASSVRPDGRTETFARANLPEAQDVSLANGGPLAIYGSLELATFSLPQFSVVDTAPADGAEQVALAGPDLRIAVELSAPPDPATVTSANVVLRASDPILGSIVPATVELDEVGGRRILVKPHSALATSTDFFVTVSTDLKSASAMPLRASFVSRFRTRATNATPPSINDVLPPAGPVEGGTYVTVKGSHFQDGARVYFSGAEATEIKFVDAQTLRARTPMQVEGPARVTVVNPDGLKGSLLGGFVYLPVLDVNFVVPATGRLIGGDVVEISGAGFQRGVKVTFIAGNGSALATEVRVLAPGKLSVKTPPGPFGPADVLVENPDGKAAMASGAFFYTGLRVSSSVGRYNPSVDGSGGRPPGRLPQGDTGQVVLLDGRAWVISSAGVNTSAKDPVELLQKSRQGAVSIVDLADPAHPAVQGGLSLPPPYEPRALAVRGSRAYIVADAPELQHIDVAGEGGPSLLVMDAADPFAPKLAEAVPFVGNAKDVALADDLALVAAGSAGLAVFSIADPNRPALLGILDKFLVGGVQQTLPVQRVRVSGRYAVITAGPSSNTTLVLDLARPGFPVVGEANVDFGDLALLGSRGFGALKEGRTISLTPVTRPRVMAPLPTLLPRSDFISAALGVHAAAAGGHRSGSSSSAAIVQINLASDPVAPLPVDAVDLFPMTRLEDVALERDLVVATGRNTLFNTVLDSLSVIQIPFPMVVASQPVADARGVNPASALRVEFNRPVTGATTSTVRLMEVDGSTDGVPVTVSVSTLDRMVTVTPASPLKPTTVYRLVVEGLRDTHPGALMPGSFVSEFETAASTGIVPMTISGLSPREGPAAGGTDVVISGTGIDQDVEVRFAGTLVDRFEVAPDGTSVRVRTKAGLAGAATVELLNPTSKVSARRTGAFLYTQPLSLASVTPNRGPASGGTRVVLQGTGFTTGGLTRVTFDGVPALRVRVLGTGRIEAVTPNGLRGPADVKVINPDNTSVTLTGGYTFDQPTGSAVATREDISDLVVIGDYAYVLGSSSLQVIDLSGLYKKGPLAGTPIPPERRNEMVDENRDYLDDRVVGRWSYAMGRPLSLSYPLEGGDRLYVGTGSTDAKTGKYISAGILELDISNPFAPKTVAETRAGVGATFALDVRGDRLLAAAGAAGLRSFDVSPLHAPFAMNVLATEKEANALAVEGGLAVMGTATLGTNQRFSEGKLHTLSVTSEPQVLGSVAVNVHRVRLRDGLAYVAAGESGLVIVDVSAPATPVVLATLGLGTGSFATDVRLAGNLAYVAAGSVGVAVVDISQIHAPKVLHYVTGASAGTAHHVSLAGGRLVTARRNPWGSWSLEFGPPAELTVVSSSVTSGELVPLDLPSVLVTLSTTITPQSGAQAFSFTADGEPIPGVLEAGTATEPVSTLLFRLSEPLPADAELRLRVSTALTTPDNHHLTAPLDVRFRSAKAEGAQPVFSQMVPRVGSTLGGTPTKLLGEGFDADVQVFVGGREALVGYVSPVELNVQVPSGNAGLADVEVINPTSGLSARRSGGFFYSLPVSAFSGAPRFFNPRGGSTVTIKGQGFLPSWASPLGSSRVRIRGVPATSVSVASPWELTATAPVGSFGDADVEVLSPDGLEMSEVPGEFGYGLAFSAEEKSVSIAPKALAADPNLEGFIYSSAGAAESGNKIADRPYIGPITGGGTYWDSLRVASYDVTQVANPRAAGTTPVSPPGGMVDRLNAVLLRYLPVGTPVPDVEIAPDSLDVATQGSRLLVANGASGLTIIDTSVPQSLQVLGRAQFGAFGSPEYATRLLPTPTGSWVLFNGMQPNPPPNPPPCETTQLAMGSGGKVRLLDTRDPTDPILVAELGDSAEPYGVALHGGRLYVASGGHEGTFYCPSPPLPPPPEYSVSGGGTGGQRTTYHGKTGQTPSGSLRIFTSTRAGATPAGVLNYPYNLTDVVVVRDTAIVAAAEAGLLFVDVSDPANPKELTALRIPFDASLSNTPGEPQRLRLFGDMLFVAANNGGVVLLDVSNPRAPKLVSGGNIEPAMDVLVRGDQLLLAGKNRLIELVLPFTFVMGVEPARESRIAPENVALVVRFNRPINPASVTSSSVRVVGPNGAVGGLTFTVTNDHTKRAYTLSVTAASLAPQTSYELQVDESVTDQHSGSLLLPFRSGFSTGAAGSQVPHIATVSPRSVSTQGGQTLTLTGTGFTGTAKVRIGNTEVTQLSVNSEGTELTLETPAAASAGPADIEVVNAGGPSRGLVAGVYYLDDLTTTGVTISPDHGPVAGGNTVSLKLPVAALAPGTQVHIGSHVATGVDIVDLSTVKFVAPRVSGAGLMEVKLVRPGQSPVKVASYSYDLPVGTTMDLPGFPPRVASELKLVGDTLYVGVPTRDYEGLEIFNVMIEERPLRLGGVRTASPVRGLDVSGALALLAEGQALTAVDVSKPEQAFEVARASALGLTTGVRVEGSKAFVSITDPGAGAGYVQAFDISHPAMLQVAGGTVALDEDALALDLGVDRFYTLSSNVQGTAGNGLRLSIYDRAGIRKGGVVVAGLTSYEQLVRSRLAVRAGRAYVTVGKRLYVFDISTPEKEQNPVVLQSTDMTDDAAGLAWAGGSLFVATAGQQTVVAVPPADLLAVELSPAPGSLAPPDTSVTVAFTLPVKQVSVDANTFAVTATNATGTTRVVNGTYEVVYAVRGSSVIFRPVAASAFLPGDTVQVTVNGIRDFDNRLLAAPVDFLFTVAANGSLQPVVSSVQPSTGLVNATTPVVITGAGFRSGTVVKVAGEAMQTTFVNAGRLEVIVEPAPGLMPGPAAVEVIDPSGISTLFPGGFLYRDPLKLLALTPDRSPQWGGTWVTLSGTGFAPGLQVVFDETASFNVQVVSTKKAVALAPPHSAGLVNVTLKQGTQSSVKTSSFLYGSGAVSRLDTPPVRHVLLSDGIIYAAVGGEVDIVGPKRNPVYELGRKYASGGLLVADPAEPTAVKEILPRQTFSASGGAWRLAKYGKRLYMASGTSGLRIYDVTLPAQPVFKSTLPGTGATVDVAVSGEMLYVADGAGVTAYRLTETSMPLRTGSRALTGGATALAVDGHRLLVASGEANNQKLHVLDARTGDLAQLGVSPIAGRARHITTEGSRAFVSLGALAQVAIYNLEPSNPALSTTLFLTDPLDNGWVSAEQTLVSGGIAYIAAGGGKVQRFAVPTDEPPRLLERAAVIGDAQTLAFMGRHLLVGTLVLDVGGKAVELPIQDPTQASGSLAGGLASVALDHIELRGTVPAYGERVALATSPQVLLTELPDPATLGAITLQDGSGNAVSVLKRAESDEDGARVVVAPYSPLTVDTEYVLGVGANLANLKGGALGVDAEVRFRTATRATAGAPRLDEVVPSYGLEAGGETVVLHGEGFLPGCTVRIADKQAFIPENGVSADGRTITLVVPAGKAGSAAVAVENPDKLSVMRLGAYRYLVPPQITKVTPAFAPTMSRTTVRIEGQGLFANSQVKFGGVAALSTTVDATGALEVTVPDNVVGAVDLSVTTSGANGAVTHTLAQGFSFTLQPLAQIQLGGDVFAWVGRTLLAARNGKLVATDLSTPGNPGTPVEVTGVTYPAGLVVAGNLAILAGRGEVVRYSLGTCGSAPGAACLPVEKDRVPLVTSTTDLSSLAANERSAYVAVAGGGELALLGNVSGEFEVVSRTLVTPGHVVGLDIADDMLAVLVQDGSRVRVEFRSMEDGALTLVGMADGLGYPAQGLATSGT